MFTSFNVFKCGGRADADVNAYLRYRFDQKRKPRFRAYVEIHATQEREVILLAEIKESKVVRKVS